MENAAEVLVTESQSPCQRHTLSLQLGAVETLLSILIAVFEVVLLFTRAPGFLNKRRILLYMLKCLLLEDGLWSRHSNHLFVSFVGGISH